MNRERRIAKRILKWFSGEKVSPYEIRFSPTDKCNLACLPCVSRGRPPYEPKKELKKERYIKIVNEAAKLGTRRFDICGGGEPFCRPILTLTIMNEIKKHNMVGSISTNGTLLTKEMIEKIVEIKWDEIRFSINGPNSEIDDYLRGIKGAFDKSIKAIKQLTYIKKKLNRKRPRVHITPIITSINYNKIPEFVELANDLNINTLILQPFMPEILSDFELSKKKRKSMSKKLKLNKKQQKEIQIHIKKAKKLAKRYNLAVNFNFLSEETVKHTTDKLIQSDIENQPKNSPLSIPCYSPWWLIDIDTHGMARPCTGAVIQEDIKKKKLCEIWNGSSFNNLRRRLASGKIPSFCKSCCAISVDDNRRFRKIILEMIDKND